jgi:hypothetical protein
MIDPSDEEFAMAESRLDELDELEAVTERARIAVIEQARCVCASSEAERDSRAALAALRDRCVTLDLAQSMEDAARVALGLSVPPRSAWWIRGVS